MGEHITADIIMAINESTKLINEVGDNNSLVSINYVVEKLKKSLKERPAYDPDEVSKIIEDIGINFGDKGPLNRAMMCIDLFRMAYSNQDVELENHCNNVKNLLSDKKDMIRSK